MASAAEDEEDERRTSASRLPGTPGVLVAPPVPPPPPPAARRRVRAPAQRLDTPVWIDFRRMSRPSTPRSLLAAALAADAAGGSGEPRGASQTDATLQEPARREERPAAVEQHGSSVTAAAAATASASPRYGNIVLARRGLLLPLRYDAAE